MNRTIHILLLALLCLPGMVRAAGEREKARLDTLREQRTTLEKQLRQSETTRQETTQRLRETEQAISAAGRRLNELVQARARVKQALAGHERHLNTLERQRQTRQRQLEQLLRYRFRERTEDALAILLAGGDPNAAARDRHYLALLSRAKAELIADLRRDTTQVRQATETVVRQEAELAELMRQETAEQAILRQRQQDRQSVLAKINQDIQSQRRQIETLRQDELRLGKVIENLGRQSRSVKPPRPAAEPASVAGKKTAAEPAGVSGTFARLRGKLPWPVEGTLSSRFGNRRDDGQSLWKGVFIRAIEGVPVKTVAAGVVVFADWLRGYGNLIIIDHDDDFLSVYGNNQSLLADVGQKVGAGGTVATAGASGGLAESGLYFELRHRGQPFDPGKWLGPR